MDDNFEKKGRDVSPTQQELEFLFSLMARGLTPRQIVEEYQDTEYPLRQHRWVSEKQRYFAAARKVLAESIKSAQDPLLVEAQRKHFEDLCSIIERLEHTVTNVTSVSVHEAETHIEWMSPYEYDEDQLTETEKADARMSMKTDGGRITILMLGIEEHPIFECLANHLEGKVWHLYQEWKKVQVQLGQKYLDYNKSSDKTELRMIDELSHYHETLRDKLLIALGRARHRRVFPGRCDACP